MKVKALFKRSIPLISVVVILISLFSMPVYATEYTSGTYSLADLFPFKDKDLTFILYDDFTFQYNIPVDWVNDTQFKSTKITDTAVNGSGPCAITVRIQDNSWHLNAGDILDIDGLIRPSVLPNTINFSKLRFRVAGYYDDDPDQNRVILEDFVVTHSGVGGIYRPFSYRYSAPRACTVDYLTFTFWLDATPNNFIMWCDGGFKIGFGSADSPAAPAYPRVDGSSIGDLGDLEQDLMDDTAAGFENATDAYAQGGASFMEAALGLQAMSKIMGQVLLRVPYLNILVQVSLAIGLFGTLVALGGSILGAADRRAGREKRQASRDARRSKK